MSTKENDDHVLPKAPALKSSASYWFGKGSSSNKDIEVRETDGEDQLKALRLLDRRPHFIFVVDATGSMTNFTTSMSSTLKQVITVMNMLYSGEASVSVVVYYDYCEAKVIKEFQTTTHVPEALHRLTEAYLALGVSDEAQMSTAVLGYNYPGSKWYEASYALLEKRSLTPARNEKSWLSWMWDWAN